MSQMTGTRIVCAIAVGLWSAVTIGAQTVPSAVLPEALRTHVKAEHFEPVTSVRGLPLGIRQQLQSLWGTADLDIAEPGTEFQASGESAGSTLPTRRLIVAGCSRDHHCLMYYQRGGRVPTWVAALFQWTPATTRLEWSGTGLGGLKTLDDVRNAVLSGAIKGPNSLW
jgi:hypothetical protein